MNRREMIGALAAVPLAAVVQPKTEPACVMKPHWRIETAADGEWMVRTTCPEWQPLTYQGKPVTIETHSLDAAMRGLYRRCR